MDMKRFLFLFSVTVALALPGATYLYAQQAPPETDTPSAVDLTTFTGIVAAVSMIVTQLAKIIPAVSRKNGLKILLSVAVAIAASLLAWHFGWASFLQGVAWWTAVCCGIAAGLAASGAYDLIKSFFTVKTV
jgi:hypothetical protein